MLACSLKAAAAAYPRSKWPRAVRIKRSGAVLEPASGAFDVTVAPDEDVQAAVDRCPRGGCVLLLPGTHAGPLALTADKLVHVFGRGEATLRTATGSVLQSSAAESTIDGLAMRRQIGLSNSDDGVWIRGGRLRLQACDVTAPSSCVRIDGGADPVVTTCRYGRARAAPCGGEIAM